MRYHEQVIQDAPSSLGITIPSTQLLSFLKEAKEIIMEQQDDIFIQIEETIKSIANYGMNTPVDTLIAVWDDLRKVEFETEDPLQKILFDFQIDIISHLIDVSTRNDKFFLNQI